MRIAIVYDCLYPYTIGGAERWYRNLAELLARRHQVTFVTRRQWASKETPDGPRGVKLVAVSGGRSLYTISGRRKITPPVRFGSGLLAHLLRHARCYDIVHTCGFPYFSLIAARTAQTLGGPPVIVDWFEIWSRDFWRVYLGRLRGGIAASIQRACVLLTDRAFVFSQLCAAQLKQAGFRGDPTVLRGMYEGPLEPFDTPLARDPLVVFVGRHIREKRVAAIPAAVARARQQIPELRALIFGDGPERGRLIAEVERLGLQGSIECPGFVPWSEIDAAMRRAACLLMPSAREGFGLVIAEAAARSTPSIVVHGPANAATELVVDGENGLTLDDADAPTLANAIIRVLRQGPTMIESTRTWFRSHASEISIESSLARIEEAYCRAIAQKQG